MSNNEISKRFLNEHYLGLPASVSNRFVQNRFLLVKNIKGFICKNLDIVEIGFGNGNTLILVAPLFKTYTGIDIYPENKLIAENYIKQYNIDNIELIIGDIEVDIIPKKFDRLICFEVIEHLKDENSVANFRKLLKENGEVCITVPHKWWIFETHGAKLPILKWNRVPFFSWLPTKIHEKYANARIYTKKRIVDLLEKNGFEVIDVKLMTAPLDFLKIEWLKKILLKTIFKNITTKCPFIATNIFVHAKVKS